MTWFSFQGGYGTIDFTGANEKAAVTLGFHGYATEAEAKAHPNSVDFLQAPELTLLIDNQAGALPTGPPGSGAIPPASAAAATSGITGVTDFVSRLGNPNLWIRVAEVVVGVVLIAIGLNSMLKGKPMSIVTNTAGAVGKAALI